ncbi:conserved hypothetical protein [delta proteobacterium NaphS2]|nr:conserved hypothetical protein [delta proteobacterium NaphS2]
MAICIFKWTESHLIYTKSEEIPSENDFFNQIIYSTGNRRMSLLVYEKRRLEPDKDEKNFPDFLDSKMFAMSELLYVADNYFDELRTTREESIDGEGTL